MICGGIVVQLKKLLEEFNSIEKELSVLQSINMLLLWDRDVNLPKKAFEQRGDQESYISVKSHELITSKKLVTLVKQLSQKTYYNKLSEMDRKRIDLYNWKLRRLLKVPKKHVEELTKLTSEAHHAWKEARKSESYKEFAPYLKKIFDMKKQEAKYVDAKAIPYNIMLEDYERGITVQELDKIYSELKSELMILLNKIKTSPNYAKINSSKLADMGVFPSDIQLEVCNDIVKRIMVDTERYMCALTIHPFMAPISSDDYRVTTAVRADPMFSFSSTSHEAGHALYESNFDPRMRNTILVTFDSISIALHESQSKFWENFICKSESFWKGYYPYYISKFTSIKRLSRDEFYTLTNSVKPSLVRIESDELTYSLHVIIRYEIERDLLSNKIKVEDLEQVWNNKYKEYLGIVPDTPSRGVLQDSHWAGGSIGYFPTYVLGNIYSAMIYSAIKKAHPQLEQDIEKLDFTFIREWLKENIHKYGASKTTKDIIKNACGKDLDIQDFVSYLRIKYYKLYGIKE